MVSLACTASREESVTLVTGSLSNPDRPRRIRLENCLDGPVWPPRRRGVPAAGWTDDGVEWTLDAGETRALGYATPAPPADPPMVVAEAEPVEPDASADFEPRVAVPDVEDSVDGVLRTLGSPLPPRDAVPTPTPTDTNAADGATTADELSGSPGKECRAPVGVDAADAWLDAVADRLDVAERLTGTARLSAAGPAVAAVGGLAGVRELDEQVAADATEVRRIADRARTLADQAEAVAIPVDLIERLA